jgi:hypothetical protein
VPTADDLTALLARTPGPGPRAGLVALSITLALFQNGSIHQLAGKTIKIARADTLVDDGLFEHENDPLEEARERFGVAPLRAGL